MDQSQRPVPNATSYLRYDRQSSGSHGLLHALANLKCLLVEASRLGRLAILPPLTLDPKHNFGFARDWQWDTYLDLGAGRLESRSTGASRPLPIAEHPPARFRSCATVQPCKGVPRQAHSAELLVRQVGGLYRNSLPPSFRRPPVRVWLPHAAAVVDRARPVIERLRSLPGGYAAVHIRRSDRLHLPRWGTATAPPSIIAKLREHGIGRNTPVYFLSDERDPGFWDALRGHCRMLRYPDFPHLAELVAHQAGQCPDNYFLFAVEQEILRHAKLRIGTYRSRLEIPTDDRLLSHLLPDKRRIKRRLDRLRRWLGPAAD